MYFAPGGCLELARKNKHRQIQEDWEEESVPQAQSGLKRVAGGAPLAQGYFRASQAPRSPALCALSGLMAVGIPPSTG